jgi:hypothetical protein
MSVQSTQESNPVRSHLLHALCVFQDGLASMTGVVDFFSVHPLAANAKVI